MNLIEISDPKLADALDMVLEEVGAQETIKAIYTGEDVSLLTLIKAKMVEAADEIDEHQEEEQPAALEHSVQRVINELTELTAMSLRYLKQFDHKQHDLETEPA